MSCSHHAAAYLAEITAFSRTWRDRCDHVNGADRDRCDHDTGSKVTFWFVYIVRCSDGSLYTGIARDVQERIDAHNAGKGARYTRGRGPLTLLTIRRCASHGNALRLELALKKVPRAEKMALVTSHEELARFARRCLRKKRP